MSLAHVLVIDDQYAWDTSLRQNFIENSGLFDTEQQAGFVKLPLADAVFCSGQRRENGEIVNDYQVVREAITAGPTDSGHWALALLDVRFDSGQISGPGNRPSGRPGDDAFGEDIRKRIATDFPDLPVVMLSSKKQHELRDRKTPYLSKTGLKSSDIAKCLLLYGNLTREQQRALLNLPDMVVAESPATFAVFREAFACADSDMAVLILGETGTGKEVLARYIHACSSRSANPFIPVNVAAIPEELVEAELFGHEKGAFTGADRKREGWFIQADGGTMFLDEIGDMPPSLQAKVLRVLQDGEVLPVGGTKPVRVDVRIIAATSRDLAAMQQTGAFREDLIRRISGVTLTIPPLRHRQEDILPLAKFFLDMYSAKSGKAGISFADETQAVLETHPFVGNVGELQHIIQWLVIRKGNHSIISAADVRDALAGSFVSAAPTGQPQQRAVSAPATVDSLAALIELVETCPVSVNDPLLQGGKSCLERAVRLLVQRMAGAALERFRDPRSGRLNRQAAMQWLIGDDTLKGKGPGRVINEILGRRADTPIKDEDLLRLLEDYQLRKQA